MNQKPDKYLGIERRNVPIRRRIGNEEHKVREQSQHSVLPPKPGITA